MSQLMFWGPEVWLLPHCNVHIMRAERARGRRVLYWASSLQARVTWVHLCLANVPTIHALPNSLFCSLKNPDKGASNKGILTTKLKREPQKVSLDRQSQCLLRFLFLDSLPTCCCNRIASSSCTTLSTVQMHEQMHEQMHLSWMRVHCQRTWQGTRPRPSPSQDRPDGDAHPLGPKQDSLLEFRWFCNLSFVQVVLQQRNREQYYNLTQILNQAASCCCPSWF